MPPRKAESSRASPRETETLLRDVLREQWKPVAEIPPPTVESFLARWQEALAHTAAGEVVPFPADNPQDALAFAARSGSTVSPETRARLAQLVHDLSGKPSVK